MSVCQSLSLCFSLLFSFYLYLNFFLMFPNLSLPHFQGPSSSLWDSVCMSVFIYKSISSYCALPQIFNNRTIEWIFFSSFLQLKLILNNRRFVFKVMLISLIYKNDIFSGIRWRSICARTQLDGKQGGGPLSSPPLMNKKGIFFLYLSLLISTLFFFYLI